MEVQYICHRCGETYSLNYYLKSRFCENCGTLLIKKVVYGTSKKKAETKMEDHFQWLVKEFFPYSNFRPFQLKAIKFAYETIRNGKVGLLSSPCGTGKSISVLTAFFAARELNPSLGRLLVLTRTKNQLEIYSRELKNIKDYCGASFSASIFKSKKEMCPYTFEDLKLRDVSYRDFIYYCKGLKDGAFGKKCEYFDKTYDEGKTSWHTYNVVKKLKKIGPLMPDEVYGVCRDEGLCPYEVTKILTKYADVIIGNYNYILVEAIRGSVLGKAGIHIEDINCVFDEAHSLPYYAAGILSEELSSRSVRRASREVETFGIDDFGLLEALRESMVNFGKQVYRNYGLDVEHIVEGETLFDTLARKLKVDGKKLLEIIHELADKGEEVRQKRSEIGRSPISYLSRCTEFLMKWASLTGPSYVRYVKVEVDRGKRKKVRLGIRCLDPALAANVVNELRSAILMSGTLWNPDYYIDVLGTERNRCRS